jgi:hypothetical protein
VSKEDRPLSDYNFTEVDQSSDKTNTEDNPNYMAYSCPMGDGYKLFVTVLNTNCFVWKGTELSKFTGDDTRFSLWIRDGNNKTALERTMKGILEQTNLKGLLMVEFDGEDHYISGASLNQLKKIIRVCDAEFKTIVVKEPEPAPKEPCARCGAFDHWNNRYPNRNNEVLCYRHC